MMAFTYTVTLSFVRIYQEWSVKTSDLSLSYLLRGDIIGLCSQVNLLVYINAGDDEEHAGPPGSARQHPAQAEHHGAFILLIMLNIGFKKI